jgi:DNA polymerase-3 subunit gamma/tau
MMAAEMAIIRLTHVAELPSPEDLIKKLQDTPPPPPHNGGPSGGGAPMGNTNGGISAQATSVSQTGTGGVSAALAPATEAVLSQYVTFEHVVELVRYQRDVKLLVEMETGIRLVSYRPGRIEFEPSPQAPNDLSQRLGSKLQAWTGARWAVTVVNDGGAKTIAEIRDAAENALREQAVAHPMVQAVVAQFPNAKITNIRTQADITAEAAKDALPEVEGEWDPFEED